METIDHLICAYDEKYIDQDTLENMRDLYTLCLKLLNGYIAYLKKVKQTTNNSIT